MSDTEQQTTVQEPVIQSQAETPAPAQTEPAGESSSTPVEQPQETEPIQPESISPQPISQSRPAEPTLPSTSSGQAKFFLAKALESIQFRKKAKLEKIIKLANEKKSITNDQVQKLLRISDATATRYLSELVRQNRLKRTGTTTNIRYEPTLGSNGGN